MWDKLSNIQKLLGVTISGFAIISTLYAAHVFLEKRDMKLESAVTHKEVVEMFNEVNSNVDQLNDQMEILKSDNQTISTNQVIIGQKIDDLKGSIKFVSNEVVSHIRKDTGIPAEDKINDILRLVQGLSEDVKKNDSRIQ